MVKFIARVKKLKLIFVLALILNFTLMPIYSLAQEAQETEEYFQTLKVSADSGNDVFVALLSTLSDFGYFIESIDVQSGKVEASLIDYPTLVIGDMWSGIDHFSEMSQTISARLTELPDSNYDVDLRITYLTKLVDDQEPYDVFFNKLKSSKYLTSQE